MQRPLFSIALILGLLTALGPFALDMYLPALPAIGENLNADTGTVQLSLMVYFVTLAVCQVFYGPLSDMFGRKRPLYVGLVLYALGSIGCALAPSIGWLIAARVLQAVGACAGTVIARAVVRDLRTGPDAAQLMAALMLVFSISPILAPIVGSVVIAIWDWRAVFWILTVFAGLGLLLAIFALEETRPVEARSESGMRSALHSYGVLLRDPYYLGVVLTGAMGMSSFLIFVSNSSFVFIEHFGLSPTMYSFAYSVNAIGFIAMAQLAGYFGRRFGLKNMMRVAVTVYALMMIGLFVVQALGIERMDVMIVMTFFGFTALGLVVPTSAVLALEEHGQRAGTASALMGSLQFGCAAIGVALVSLFFDGRPIIMVAGIAACSFIALIIAHVVVGRQREVVAVE